MTAPKSVGQGARASGLTIQRQIEDLDHSGVLRAITHDARQPLSAVTNALGALKARLVVREDLALVRTAEAAVRELTRLFEGAVDYLSIGAGALRPEQRIVPLHALLQDVCAANAIEAAGSGVRLYARPTSLCVISDRRYLTRVINNLVINAITHANATVVFVAARVRGSGCAIEVRDNGRGIDPEARENIFKLGWRGQTTAPGSGIGLYVVQSFVASLSGSVDVRSEPGRGSVFRIWLPGPIRRAAHEAAPARQIGHPLSGKVIALLEDQRPVLESLRALFEALGAAVIAGESEVEFLAETSKLERAPDLFIMDFMIQRDVLASRCLTLLRQRFGYSNVRALILTGNPSHPELRNVFGVPVVEKPLSEQALKKIIAALLGQIPWDSSAFA